MEISPAPEDEAANTKKGECARFPFSGRGGVHGRIFQDILLIFSPKVQIWDKEHYSKKN